MRPDIGWELNNATINTHRTLAETTNAQVLSLTASEVRKQVSGFLFIISRFESKTKEASIRQPARSSHERQNQ